MLAAEPAQRLFPHTRQSGMRSQTTDCSKKLSNTLQPSPPIALEMLRQAIAAHQSGKFADAERLYRRALEG